MRQFKKTKRVLTRAEQMTMRENAIEAARRGREILQEKERLIAEGKMRKEIIVSTDGKTKRFRYIPIND
jgi:hypothetical protein